MSKMLSFIKYEGGSSNVFANLGLENPEALQPKARLTHLAFPPSAYV